MIRDTHFEWDDKGPYFNEWGDFVFNVEGIEHIVGDNCFCDSSTNYAICDCGGRFHYITVYGGYYHICDKCRATK